MYLGFFTSNTHPPQPTIGSKDLHVEVLEWYCWRTFQKFLKKLAGNYSFRNYYLIFNLVKKGFIAILLFLVVYIFTNNAAIPPKVRKYESSTTYADLYTFKMPKKY